MICGLILWNLLGIGIGIASALILDALLQFSAGIIDFFVGNSISSSSQAISKNSMISPNPVRSRHLISSIIFLTIGIQVVIFSLAQQASSQFTPLILAFYYLGAAIAAVFCKKFKILLEWNRANKINFARIFANSKINSHGTSFIMHGIFSSACVAIAIFGVIYWQWSFENSMFKIGNILLLFFIFLAAFFYEILALAILDRIGIEERNSKNKNMLMSAYGLMGVSAAISLWLLSLSKNATNSLFFTLFSCVLLSIVFTSRRTA